MFYVVRFNAAAAALGINPRDIPTSFRNIGQIAGKGAGCTPQEAVLIVLSQLPLAIRWGANPNVARRWVAEGKVALKNQAIQDALVELRWDFDDL